MIGPPLFALGYALACSTITVLAYRMRSPHANALCEITGAAWFALAATLFLAALFA